MAGDLLPISGQVRSRSGSANSSNLILLRWLWSRTTFTLKVEANFKIGSQTLHPLKYSHHRLEKFIEKFRIALFGWRIESIGYKLRDCTISEGTLYLCLMCIQIETLFGFVSQTLHPLKYSRYWLNKAI